MESLLLERSRHALAKNRIISVHKFGPALPFQDCLYCKWTRTLISGLFHTVNGPVLSFQDCFMKGSDVLGLRVFSYCFDVRSMRLDRGPCNQKEHKALRKYIYIFFV
jgi:hypothetical protein